MNDYLTPVEAHACQRVDGMQSKAGESSQKRRLRLRRTTAAQADTDRLAPSNCRPKSYVWRRRLLAQSALLIGTMVWSLEAGAVTIREVLNSSPKLCDQFVSILKTAGVPYMTDTQLCQFQFDQLPASTTKEFTFPRWTKLSVSDPAEMFKRIVLARWSVSWANSATPEQFFGNYIQGLNQSYQLVLRAANERALNFYEAALPAHEWSGVDTSHLETLKFLPKNFYLVQMQANTCSDKTLRHLPNPDYAVSYQPDMKESFDSASLGDSEIALWHGILLLIHVDKWWSDQSERHPQSVNAAINWAVWYPPGYSNVNTQTFRAGFDPGRTICSYSIEK